MRHLVSRMKNRLGLTMLSHTQRRHALVGPPELWRFKRQFQIQFLKRAGLKPYHHLLDIGCGTLRGGIALIGYLDKEHYFGIESRPNVLEEGRKELAETNLTWKAPTLISVADLSKLRLRREFDYVWAYSVFLHMTDDILRTALNLARQCLRLDGKLYANVNIGRRREGEWQGFPVVWRSFDFYQQEASKSGLQVEDMGALKTLGHVTGYRVQDEQHMLRMKIKI